MTKMFHNDPIRSDPIPPLPNTEGAFRGPRTADFLFLSGSRVSRAN